MAGSGLKELLEVIYASNAVDNILTNSQGITTCCPWSYTCGCSAKRHVHCNVTDALERPHDGMQGATNDPPANTAVSNRDLKETASLFDNLMSLDKTIEEVCSADVLCRIRNMIERQKEALKHLRTACLWLQYMDMMDILRRFIKSERTGNWDICTLFVRCFHTSCWTPIVWQVCICVPKQHAGVGGLTN